LVLTKVMHIKKTQDIWPAASQIA